MTDRRAPTAYDEPLSPEEFARRLDEIRVRMADPEAGEETRELSRWFLRRYPSVIDRCRYVTRKHREWTSAPKIPPDRVR